MITNNSLLINHRRRGAKLYQTINGAISSKACTNDTQHKYQHVLSDPEGFAETEHELSVSIGPEHQGLQDGGEEEGEGTAGQCSHQTDEITKVWYSCCQACCRGGTAQMI